MIKCKVYILCCKNNIFPSMFGLIFSANTVMYNTVMYNKIKLT